MNTDTATRTAELRSLIERGALDAARTLGAQLLAAHADDADLLQLAAVIERRHHNWSAAAELTAAALRQHADDAQLLAAYAGDLIQLGRVEQAAAALAKVAAEDRGRPAVMLQTARLQYQRRQYDQACDTLLAVTRVHRDFAAAHLELAHVLLMRGKWRAGWLAYEARYRLPQSKTLLPKFRSPHWDGGQLAGRILLIADQGYGDCFQFCRYIPLVAQRCKEVVVLRSAPLARLLDSVPGIAASYQRWEEAPAHHAHSTLSGLPRLFATRPDNIPACTGLLSVDDTLSHAWHEKIERDHAQARLRVGITWSGRSEFRDNQLRAIPVQALAPLKQIPGVELFSLQVGPLAAQAAEFGIVDYTAQLSDFADTAAFMQTLDLVITTDTAVAHLAGTLGRPTWVLLSYAPDWRWGPGGTRSDWYPSVRLLRQDSTCSWEPLIADARNALAAIVAAPDVNAALTTFGTQHADRNPDSTA